MTSAAFTILFMRVALEWHSIVFCSIGATLGIVLGIEFVEPNMTKEQKKMFFVSIWFAFACALFLLNTQKKRKTYLNIQLFTWWKAVLLVVTGLVGGWSLLVTNGVPSRHNCIITAYELSPCANLRIF